MKPSPYLVTIPDPACDLVITTANAATTLNQLSDPDLRVFCVDPGDYRSYAGRILREPGTSSSPRYLRFNGPGAVKAFERTSQAILERLDIRADWWVIQGLTFRPRSSATSRIVSLNGVQHVVLDGNLIDAIEHPNGPEQNGVTIVANTGYPASHNTVQRNVIRNGDQSHQAIDYEGVLIAPGFNGGEDNDDNRILDNEIYDWGDAIAVAGITEDCSDPGVQHGTVIDGNDAYLTPAKYVDCKTGVATSLGQCACAENGIDVKADPGPDPASWTRITNNRVWGFRPTTEAVVCGGSGANGQAITAGTACPTDVLVARNLVSDSTIGIEVAGSTWIVAGNLVHDIHASDSAPWGTMAIFLSAGSSYIAVQWNTIVNSLIAYDDASSYTDTRCNTVIRAPGWGGGLPRGVSHVTDYNYLYESSAVNFVGSTNRTFASAVDSLDPQLCYERKRWTGAVTVCVPDAATASMSPQLEGAPHCNGAIAAQFGIPKIGYWMNSGSCGLGGELVGVLAALRWWGRRARSDGARIEG